MHLVLKIILLAVILYVLFIFTVLQQFDEGNSLLDIARAYKFSPYKLAKLYVKHILRLKDNFNLSKLLNNEIQLIVPLQQHSELHPSPPQVSTDRLKSNLIQCCLEDNFSSQTSDAIKNCVGQNFEELLYDLMRQKKMVSPCSCDDDLLT